MINAGYASELMGFLWERCMTLPVDSFLVALPAYYGSVGGRRLTRACAGASLPRPSHLLNTIFSAIVDSLPAITPKTLCVDSPKTSYIVCGFDVGRTYIFSKILIWILGAAYV